MKKIIFVLFALAIGLSSLFAQGAKRYALLEHFTNTRCPICASKNPSFYNTISNYPELVHHISIHPPIPYVNCRFYQENTTDNDARKSFYNVVGSPTVFLNGTATGSSLITNAQLMNVQSMTSPIEVVVEETGGTDREVSISIKSVMNVPAGNYRLFAAVVEKTINYNAPNGETVHHDVLREFVSSNSGDPIIPATAGGSVDVDYSFTVENDWANDEIYVLAWVQDISTKAVLNSGTKFDPRSSSTRELSEADFDLAPNPVKDVLNIRFENNYSGTATLHTIDGKEVQAIRFQNEANLNFNMSGLSKGTYLVKLDTDAGQGFGKVVKE